MLDEMSKSSVDGLSVGFRLKTFLIIILETHKVIWIKLDN